MSKSRVLALLSKEPELLEICKRIEGRFDDFKTQMEFIKKQAENANTQLKAANEPDWELITARLKETGALEKYDKETHHLSFSVESNCIELCPNESDHPLEKIFGHLLR